MTERPIRIGFVLHEMKVAGAEMLVAAIVRRLGRWLDPVILCLDGAGELGTAMRAEGVPVVDLGRKPGFDAAVVWHFGREIERRRLEVVHAHQYTPFFYAAFARLLVRRRVHVMFTEHGRHHPDRVSRRRRLVNWLLLRHLADEINGVCRFSIESLARLDGFTGKRLEVIDNGIDLPRYGAPDRSEARARLGLPADRRYIIAVARLHPVKDHATLIRAFARVAMRFADVDLLLAGDGPLRDDLQRLASTLGVGERVRFMGVRSDVPVLLRAADIYALTSQTEAASLTLLEAMASQLPVVVTAVGGNPEIVSDGQHGFLVPPADDRATADTLIALLNDPDRAQMMGENGRRTVRDRFQLQHTIDAYLERYLAAAARLRPHLHSQAAA